MTAELLSLQAEYNELCQLIDPHDGEYSFSTEAEDVGAPHVEFTGGEYQYIVTERGLELERRSTAERREILYWMLYDLTFWMGVAFELKSRVEGPDVRRKIFAHQLELMNRADQQFAEQLESHIAETLSRHPFVDHA